MSESKIPLCNHVKDNGELCRAIALKGKPFCYFHQRHYEPGPLPGEDGYVAPLLECNHSIQLALTQLYQAFLGRKLNLKEATFALHVLRLAAKTVKTIQTGNPPATTEIAGNASSPSTPKNVGRLQNGGQSPSTGKAPTAKPACIPSQPAPAESKRAIYDPYGCFTHYNSSIAK